ncbi:unnamed protein product [Somion occarium]|uniref:Uncharacterized protein n=1 Tax=Somion occarium TaxID=3059160 RepID=A0ABP1DZV9_9APHY
MNNLTRKNETSLSLSEYSPEDAAPSSSLFPLVAEELLPPTTLAGAGPIVQKHLLMSLFYVFGFSGYSVSWWKEIGLNSNLQLVLSSRASKVKPRDCLVCSTSLRPLRKFEAHRVFAASVLNRTRATALLFLTADCGLWIQL